MKKAVVVSPARSVAATRLRAWLSRDAWLHVVTLGVSLALLVAFVIFKDLPMVDLPQHAAQIVAWQRLDAGVPEVVERFELNFRTPYLLAYPVARVLAPLFGTILALKLVVWLSVVANLAAVESLARRLGHDPWLGLFGLVTAMGLCFYFGFISFMLAMPLAVGSLVVALEHARAPNFPKGALLALLMSLLLTAHGVSFVMGFGCVGLLLLRGGGAWFARLLPLLVPALIAALWFAPGPASVRIGGDMWALSPYRLLELPAMLVGWNATDRFELVLGIALLASALLALGVRFERRPERWLSLALLFLGYCFFPTMFRGIVLLHTRLPCFLLPLALLALKPQAPELDRRSARSAIFGVTLTWLVVFSLRLATFNREAAPFHTLAAVMPRGLSVRPLIFDRDTDAFPGVPAYMHYSAYYFVEQGGSQGYSFAMYPLSVVRYKPGVVATMQGGLEWRPDLFRQWEIPSYDYFVVRSYRDRSAELFDGTPVELRVHVGPWWGYARKGSTLVGAGTPSADSAGGT